MRELKNCIKTFNSLLSEYNLNIEVKEWETELLNKNVFSLNFQNNSVVNDKILNVWSKYEDGLKEYGFFLIVSRISAEKNQFAHFLEDIGFHIIENYVEFKHNLSNNSPSYQNDNILIRSFFSEDLIHLKRIAFESFSKSRFHIDPLIDDTIANKSRVEWVMNSVSDENMKVFIADTNGLPVGFMIYKEKKTGEKKIGVLDLIAVDKNHRGLGIGNTLTEYFLKLCNELNCEEGVVGTQGHNVNSINMYIRNGFKLNTTYYTFHKHG